MGAQLAATSLMASPIVSGTPSAVPDAPAKLDRMSCRTTPARVRTSGPFDPSPGKGPAVSSGIRVQSAEALAAEVAPAPLEAVTAAVAAAPELAGATGDADAVALRRRV